MEKHIIQIFWVSLLISFLDLDARANLLINLMGSRDLLDLSFPFFFQAQIWIYNFDRFSDI